MARQTGARTAMALAFESTYGTTPASGFVRMPFASIGLGASQPLIANELLGYGRDPLAPIKDAVTASGGVVVPVDTDALGYWLKGLLGQPTTTGTTPKTHTFTSGNATLPSLSIEKQMPDVPDFAMYSGIRVDRMTIELQRAGLLQATFDLIAQGETPAATTQAGTLAAQTLNRFGHFNGSIKRDTVALGNIVSARIGYSNNFDPVQTIRADGKIDGADPGIASADGNIVVRFADTTLRTQAINGTPCALEFSLSISANASLTITYHAVYLPIPTIEIAGPQGVEATFDWQAALAASPARMMTAVLVNTVAAY